MSPDEHDSGPPGAPPPPAPGAAPGAGVGLGLSLGRGLGATAPPGMGSPAPAAELGGGLRGSPPAGPAPGRWPRADQPSDAGPDPYPDPACGPRAGGLPDAEPDFGQGPRAIPLPDDPLFEVGRELEGVERWVRDGGGRAGDGCYEVEAITVDSMHHVVRSSAEAGDAAVLRSVVRALLDLAGHRSGPSRIGVAFTDGLPRIVALDLAPPPDEGAGRTPPPEFPRTGNAPGPVRERPPAL